MCGIIGYAGFLPVAPMLTRGLKRLEYRGYDSAGVAVASEDGLSVVKAVGNVDVLAARDLPAGTLGVGHTRWATHGRPSEANAHPHMDCSRRFAVVHNGIFENHAELRQSLEDLGHVFQSSTDTEVLAHLVEACYEGDLATAVKRSLKRVRGAYAVAVMSSLEPDVIVVARHRSNLVLAQTAHGQLVASDVTAIIGEADQVIALPEGGLGIIRRDRVEVFLENGDPVTCVAQPVEASLAEATTQGFEHYMLKEIHEIPRALEGFLEQHVGGIGSDLGIEGDPAAIGEPKRIAILACGTSYHAGLVGRHLIEHLARLPVEVHLASEYRYAEELPPPDTLVVGISQSGETVDTLEALRKAARLGHPTLAITNVRGSMLSREVDATMLMRAGPEIGVAATKTFVNTLAGLTLLGAHIGRRNGELPEKELESLRWLIGQVPNAARRVLEDTEAHRYTAEKYLTSDRAFYLGRSHGHGLALEGALKLKEIAYVGAEGYAAGELKHGPLALLEPGFPIVACIPRDETHDIMLSNIAEVRARGAYVVALVEEGDDSVESQVDAVLSVPSPDPRLFAFPAAVSMYLLSYYAAKARGCAIDKPRNLAKSVTVE